MLIEHFNQKIEYFPVFLLFLQTHQSLNFECRTVFTVILIKGRARLFTETPDIQAYAEIFYNLADQRSINNNKIKMKKILIVLSLLLLLNVSSSQGTSPCPIHSTTGSMISGKSYFI